MRISQFLISTLRDAPTEAETISHQLMLRAGMVRQIAAGVYAWLPLGLKVLRKVEAIVREEMDRCGVQELLMPGVQPGELWQESGRWSEYGPELLRFTDRHDRDFCLGPTHEEIITALVRREIRSYKQLPSNFYQIQTKFRDEVRPRFGIMRAREFLMKDAYSFHLDQDCLARTYQDMYDAYSRIFDRVGLEYRAVIADTGNIGGSGSHEFHVLAESGEDDIAFSAGGFAANVEMAPCEKTSDSPPAASAAKQEVATPEHRSIDEVSSMLGVAPAQCLKTLIVEGLNDNLVALVLRGDHELNPVKAQKHPAVATPLRLASENAIQAALGCGLGSLGPIELGITTVVDHEAAIISDFVCGANKDGYHFTGVNWGRDLEHPASFDLRNILAGDPSPDGSGPVEIKRGIEVGHIFQLGTKYSEAMNATVLNESGSAQTLVMGCYGIGVSRIVAAAIEQNHDGAGIIWPTPIAPFNVALAPINMHKSERLNEAASSLYEELVAAGLDVLFYDAKERPGVMFNDLELIGIPHRIVISDRGLDSNTVEYKERRSGEDRELSRAEVVAFITARVTAEMISN